MVAAPLLPLFIATIQQAYWALGQAAAPPTSARNRLPPLVVLDRRRHVNGSFSHVDDAADWYQAMRAKQGVLEESLSTMLPTTSIRVIADFFMPAVDPKPFAEALYRELKDRRISLLKELYDFDGDVPRTHGFWVYLSEETLSATLVFVHMLREAFSDSHHNTDIVRVAALAASQSAQAAYLVGRYFPHEHYPLMLANTSPDEWPRVLAEDAGTFWRLHKYDYGQVATWIHFLLMHQHLELFAERAKAYGHTAKHWFWIFRCLDGIKHNLLLRLFQSRVSFVNRRFFQALAPVALNVDPTLGDSLAQLAMQEGWTLPAPPTDFVVQSRARDDGRTGGDVHMQPLLPFSHRTSDMDHDGLHVASSSGKTVLSRKAVLFIAPGSLLHIQPRCCMRISVRRFDSGAVDTYDGSSYQPIKVQHGDVIAMARDTKSLLFLHVQVDCKDLPAEECVERLQSFCFLAKDKNVDFVAIVKRDESVQHDAETRLVARAFFQKLADAASRQAEC